MSASIECRFSHFEFVSVARILVFFTSCFWWSTKCLSAVSQVSVFNVSIVNDKGSSAAHTTHMGIIRAWHPLPFVFGLHRSTLVGSGLCRFHVILLQSYLIFTLIILQWSLVGQEKTFPTVAAGCHQELSDKRYVPL